MTDTRTHRARAIALGAEMAARLFLDNLWKGFLPWPRFADFAESYVRTQVPLVDLRVSPDIAASAARKLATQLIADAFGGDAQ